MFYRSDCVQWLWLPANEVAQVTLSSEYLKAQIQILFHEINLFEIPIKYESPKHPNQRSPTTAYSFKARRSA